MPSTYTTSLRLTLPATGENSGTWGNIVNTGITQLVDDAVAGTASITIGGSDYTLSNTDGATNEARKMFIVATGSPGAARNVICPAASKLYFLYNNVTGGHALTLKTLSGSGITVPNGKTMALYCNGTNVTDAITNLSSFTIGGFTLTLGGNATFANAFTTVGAYGVTLTATNTTSVTLPTTGTLATLAGTETLTNKRVNPRVDTIASAATITPTADTCDVYTVTALATNPTFAIPSGTPVNGQKLMIRIKDNGSSRTMSWTTTAGGYRVIGTVLPTTTTINKTIYVGCVYNSDAGYWDVVGIASEV